MAKPLMAKSRRCGRLSTNCCPAPLRWGGGVEYCHGLGTKLQAWVVEEWGDALPLARWLKQALDPNGTLNPRKLGLT